MERFRVHLDRIKDYDSQQTIDAYGGPTKSLP